MIEIFVNDKTITVGSDASLLQVLTRGGFDPSQPFAVALNGEFLPKSRYATVQLNNGDQLDVVSPVGGG